MNAWIEIPREDTAGPELKSALAQAQTPHGTVDNVMRVHGLRPATMVGHVELYRAVLHNDANTLPVWLQETIGSYVAHLNGCAYSYANHWANARHKIADDERADRIERGFKSGTFDDVLDAACGALLNYAEKLTRRPAMMIESDVAVLRSHGWDDGQILEANQIIAYFAYVTRHLNGLGVTTAGDVIGYYADREGCDM
ncbi:MAG: peroxidase-related enzyme [Rhodobacteraceae bacterium]|nr:peroxidase-related enzyme [Paracoccaceae bacterium]